MIAVPIQKENGNGKPIIYKMKFIDSVRFKTSLKDFTKVNAKIVSLASNT